MDTLRTSFYRHKRYFVYFIISVISLSMPFIKINDNHIFLLSFDKKQLHLMGVAFDMQELYLMPFLLMLLFLGIFAITSIGGRAWCGWSCPQTIFRVIYRDLIESWLLKLRRIKNKQKEPDLSKNNNLVKKIIGISLWSILALIAASNFMWYFVPPEDFFTYIQDPSEHIILMGFIIGITLFLIYDVVFLKENFCVYVCPYSRVQSVLYDDDTYQAIYSTKRGGDIYNEDGEKSIFKVKDLPDETNECTTCESCVTVCPTHIDIRKGMQLECINCLECVDACTSVMGKLGKESLVQWTSSREIKQEGKTRILRKTSIMYMFALSLVLIALVIMGGKKENMLLNINKTSQLYKTYDVGKISNHFIFLFQNTQSENYTYDLEIVGDNKNRFKIEKFKPFTLNAKKNRKKVIRISTNKEYVKLGNKVTNETLQIRAFSVEKPNEISVVRDFVFSLPPLNEVKK